MKIQKVPKYIIYKITNLINKKIYIGVTKNKLHVRWTQHKSNARLNKAECALYKAMRKYGIENFTVDVLLKVKNTDTVNMYNTERKYIEMYKSTKNDVGYNMTLGGEGVLGFMPWNKGKKNPQTSKKQLG